MVKDYFRLTLVYMVSGDHRNHPTNSLPEFLGIKNPARTKRSSGVSIGGESYEQDHFWLIAEQGSYVATLFASLVEMYEFAT